jgi:predicted Zn-dependent protease
VLRAGRAADAVAALEPLLGGPAETPEVLIEAAAGYAAGGDAPTARALAERAVGLSPAFAGGWAVLTRLAGDDGGPVAKRAARNQPRSYLAGLATLKFLSGEDRRRRADELIERFAADAHPEERPYLAAAFGRAFAELLGADPEAAGVLGRACRAFPESARLADAHAAVLYAAGRVAEAAGEHTRAAGLERIHRAFALEYPDPAAARRLWAVGEYARTYAPEEPSGA